jgi:hypothetical protein
MREFQIACVQYRPGGKVTGRDNDGGARRAGGPIVTIHRGDDSERQTQQGGDSAWPTAEPVTQFEQGSTYWIEKPHARNIETRSSRVSRQNGGCG